VVGTMTDRPQTSASPLSSAARPKAPAAETPPASAHRSARAGNAHPLLSAFPLSVMTLGVFMVLFALMMTRLEAGADPALRPSTSTALHAESPGASAVTTRTSGGGEPAATTPVAGSEESSGGTAAIVTRTSGATGGAPGTTEAGDE